MPLVIQLEARNDCRHGLPGLTVLYLGVVRTIRHTAWSADSALLVYLDRGPGEPPAPVEELVLLDEWAPSRCCKSSTKLLRLALARRCGTP